VADVISLKEKRIHADGKKAADLRKRKVQAVQRVFQCTHCAFKCEKCGTQISRKPLPTSDTGRIRVPYHFCDACSEEYLDYVDRLQGGGDVDAYWHNEAWLNAWQKWIDYQGSVDRYIKSKEFLRLLQELRQLGPEE
jgi:hypothetical protein